MSNTSLKVAVLFLVFNRLDTTKQVFEAIREAKPPQFYIASDGPRATHFGEDKKVQAVRDYVLANIDWGCKSAVESAITWFFEHEEMGIIL